MIPKPMNATGRKVVAQVMKMGRRLKCESCSWRLVRYERDGDFGFVDVESWTSDELSLFGMLALMLVHRDHARGGGMFELVCYCPKRVVVARVKARR